ncbi:MULTISPECIES: TrbG/VirB9 family P-type conjugative transfer protein [Campylobacter]|uniref:TrbG/VirB9 family P-type conjugative transfer protein n=1 Tax=Campylobacter TaxID=194 RepID=UPI00073AA0DE|nr:MULTISPECIES: TrbG/VirB9 family P-type conjugative transfer protein [Campylobacter]ALV00707.1 Conjugal transfer protein [Campylobacter coli]EAK0249154.1 type IV secretion system protein VirB9 [Campylobacter jejuni]EDP1825861.1 type IV secretion system protein VirB9 [Campylobacter jejuni]MEA8939498.1 TrbG/VirB9 family P-type conjugative transfer protein [Campylobacter jejuni]RTJ06238.1 type IV secretion system protein VirB9 [Campylobacter jejuni]
MRKYSKIAFIALFVNLTAFADNIQIQDVPNPNTNTGESILQTKEQALNNYTQTNIKIDPLGNQGQGQRIDNSSYANPQYQAQAFDTYSQSNGEQLSEEQIALMKSAIRNQNLNALQQRFFQKKYSGYENTLNLDYQPNKTQKIRTRFAMATTLIFETDITNYILGDTTGFKVEEIPSMPNAIAIKPMLIGIDTSLTIFTKDNKLHTFYIFSTDYKNSKDPSLVIYIHDQNSKELIKEKQEKLAKDYLIIKEGIAEVRVKKSEIYNHYSQKAKKGDEWLISEEIFNDKKFTYFKYDKDKMPQVPAIFAVIDKQDSPVETRIIGNYVIAETTAKKFTIKSGDSYVCVERLDQNKKAKK